MERSVKGIASQLGSVALGGGETADGGIDGVDVDERGSQHRLSVDHLRHRGRRSLGCTATLAVNGDRIDPPLRDRQRDPRQIPASSTPGSARKGTLGHWPTAALIAQVVLEELSIHAIRVKRLSAGLPQRQSQVSSDRIRFVPQLPPGHPKGSPALRHQNAITLPVGLESLPGAVHATAV